MNRHEFKRTLDKVLKHYSIAPNEYIISSGGALLMYGLREASRDIDISVCKRVWDILKKKFTVTSYGDEHPLVIHSFFQGIEVEFYADFKKVVMESETIDGVRVLDLAGVLFEKEHRVPQTERDLHDIKAIKELMARRAKAPASFHW